MTVHKPQEFVVGEFENKPIKITVPSNAELIAIADIDRTGRIRTNYGDIEALANTMLEVGLEQPIVITPSMKLIKGERRIQSFQSLGATVIPFVFLDVDDLIAAGFIATGARKDYTTREIGKIIQLIEEKRILGRPGKDAKVPSLTGKTVNIVSKITGDSPAQLSKIKTIVEEADKNPKFEKFLDDLDAKKKSINTVHTLLTIADRNIPKIAAPVGKTSLLLVDWPYKFKDATQRGSALSHYPLMTLDEICDTKLPIGDEAVVAMWTPNSMKYDKIKRKVGTRDVYDEIPKVTLKIPASIGTAVLCKKTTKDVIKITSTMQHILDAHGLEVGAEIIWYKDRSANGSYTFGDHETLLLCFKGKKVVPMKRFKSVIEAPVGEHSAKPKIFAEMLLEMYPERPDAIEMYQREPTKGFKGYGNQVK